MRKLLLGLLAIVSILGWGVVAQAAPILSPNGVRGLEVDNVFYDIVIGDFGGRTIGEIYSGYDLSTTPDPTLIAINNALVDLFTDRGVTMDYLDGCEPGGLFCIVFIPTSLTDYGAVYATGHPSGPNPSGVWHPHSGTRLFTDWVVGDDFEMTAGYVTAYMIPAPGTTVLFGLGLIVLGVNRKRWLAMGYRKTTLPVPS